MTVSRVTAVWTGWPGGPGFSSFHFGNLIGSEQLGVDAVHRLLRGIYSASGSTSGSRLPLGVTINLNVDVEHYVDETGELESVVSTTEPEPIEGIYPDAWSSAVGICASWTTSQINRGRRIRGRTFFVPHADAMSTDGTVPAAALTRLRDVCREYVETAPFPVVWSRPRNGAGGEAGLIDSANVADKSAVLRSRRD